MTGSSTSPPRSRCRTLIPVVAAVIQRDERYLVGRRPIAKRHGGLWEFPGGKIEEGESWREGAARELHEELGVGLRSLGATVFERQDPGSPYLIRFIEVAIEGNPVALEHSEVGWFTLDELRGMPLAPSDAAFVADRGREPATP